MTGSQSFLVEITPKVCSCKAPTTVLFRSRSQDKALEVAQAHWSLYVGFFGNETMWLHIHVVDARDGRLLWSNGRRMTEREVAESGSTLF